MERPNPEMTKQGLGIKSIIKDYTKLRDWELEVLVKRGYEAAIAEDSRRRGLGAQSQTIQR